MALQAVDSRLRAQGCQVKDRVGIVVFGYDMSMVYFAHRIQRHHHGLLPGQRLQLVEQVVKAHATAALPGSGRFVIPGRPRCAFLRQHADVRVQHGTVRLVANRAEQLTLGRAGVRQQCQRLVRVRGHHHVIETFGTLVCAHQHALGAAHHAPDGGGQPCIRQQGDQLVDVVA